MLTTAQLATRHSVSPQTINRHAARHGIGTLVNPRCRMFTAGDAAKIKRLLKVAENREPPSSDEMRRRVNLRWQKA